MLFGQDRRQIRYHFFETWRKKRSGQPLEPLEKMLADIIDCHPEYHSLLTDPDTLEQDYTPDLETTNPFLHMGLHIAIQEQLSTDRPPGIAAIYGQLYHQWGDPHTVEHRMMECLGDILWQARHAATHPDEFVYLQRLKRLIR